MLDFISYKGTITAVAGPASGQTSTDIGITRTASTSIELSIQESSSGCSRSEFTWQSPSADSFGSINTKQSFPNCECGASTGGSANINEFHYDDCGTDKNEAVEIATAIGTDLSGWNLIFYNDNDSGPYDSIALSSTVTNSGNGFGFVVFGKVGIQNGPDRIALIDPSGAVIEFLCYEGTFAVIDGPASGQRCTDIGAAEIGTTPAARSFQKYGCGENTRWRVEIASFGSVNADQILGPAACPTALVLNIYDGQGLDLTPSVQGQKVNECVWNCYRSWK